jgi:glycosyltransferase involved in cell wall biosynthesis
MDRLKILWFNWRCWLNPTMGGAEVYTREVAKRWIQAGHEITLFTSAFPNCKPDEVLDGVRVVRSGGKYSMYLDAKKYYKKYFSKEDYDVVIDEVNTRPFFTPKFVKNGESIFVLIHQLAREFWNYEMRFPVNYIGYHFLEDRWLRNYVNVPTVTVSESTKADLMCLGFKQVTIAVGGINFKPLDNVPKKESFPVMIYAGRLKRAKGPDYAIKAFRDVKNRFPDAEFWVVGSGVFKDDLVRLAGDGVRFFGDLSNEERRSLIGRAWMLVHPSIREGFPLNIPEANALGTPCIGFNVSGVKDAIIDNETGLLVDSHSAGALGEKICQLIGNEGLRDRLSENALVYSRSFSWDKTAEEFMAFIRTVMGPSKSG